MLCIQSSKIIKLWAQSDNHKPSYLIRLLFTISGTRHVLEVNHFRGLYIQEYEVIEVDHLRYKMPNIVHHIILYFICHIQHVMKRVRPCGTSGPRLWDIQAGSKWEMWAWSKRIQVGSCLTSYSNRYPLLRSLARCSSGNLVSTHVPTTWSICWHTLIQWQAVRNSYYRNPVYYQRMKHLDLHSLQPLCSTTSLTHLHTLWQ